MKTDGSKTLETLIVAILSLSECLAFSIKAPAHS